MKLVIEFVGGSELEHFEWNVTVKSVLASWLMNLQNFMFSDKYHLATSALAHAMGNMGNIGLMLWVTSFNCCRASLLLLLMNLFLKVRNLYLDAGSTIPGAFQGSILE